MLLRMPCSMQRLVVGSSYGKLTCKFVVGILDSIIVPLQSFRALPPILRMQIADGKWLFDL